MSKDYFYLVVDGEPQLHRKIIINLGKDTLRAWNYPLRKRVVYTYSQVRLKREPAFTNGQVAKLLMRKYRTIRALLDSGKINKPQRAYSLDGEFTPYMYLWHESNILEAHEALSNTHRGRPRKDGLIAPQALPSLRELKALIRNEQVMYIKDEDGEFVPVFRTGDYS